MSSAIAVIVRRGLAFLPLAAACDGLDGVVGGPICTAVVIPGLAVSVRDDVTGVAPAPPFRVIARDGAFADTATMGFVRTEADGDAVLAFSLAHERPGTYTVIVEHPDYRPWRRDGIRVGADECHVRTVEVDVRLAPLP